MSADNSVHDHLTNEEYNIASEVWYHAELVLKQCVEAGDDTGALDALDTLKEAVYRRFQPILTHRELASTLLGILGGILHFACRDAGLPPGLSDLDDLMAEGNLHDCPYAGGMAQEPERLHPLCLRTGPQLFPALLRPSHPPVYRLDTAGADGGAACGSPGRGAGCYASLFILSV